MALSFADCSVALRRALDDSATLQRVCDWGPPPTHSYRLGDLVQWPWTTRALREHTLTHFPDSVASRFVRRNAPYAPGWEARKAGRCPSTRSPGCEGPARLDDSAVISDLWAAIDATQPRTRPPLHAAIHLRLGDVVDAPFGSALPVGAPLEQRLCRRELDAQPWKLMPNAYVIQWAAWQGVARRLRALRVRRVHLVASAFYTPNYRGLSRMPQRGADGKTDALSYAAAREKPRFPRSCEYLRLVAHSLRAANVSVSFRIDAPPDEDLALMARARLFVPTGGGFSALISKLVRARGGAVLHPSPAEFCGDRYVPLELQTDARVRHMAGCVPCNCTSAVSA
jgi:hypothetical protein